jgi:hypothetical protein
MRKTVASTRHSGTVIQESWLRSSLLWSGSAQPGSPERRTRLEAHTSGWSTEDLDALDAQLKGEDTLWPLFHRYVAAHPSECSRD